VPDLLAPIVGAALALVLAWLVLVAVLWLHRPSRDRAAALLRLLPDLVRLCYRLARDPATPRRYRIGLMALGVYLASPLDLIPDVIPGIGALDDVILTGIVLRWVGRGVGRGRIDRHWPGSAAGLAAVHELLGPG
jgi:uncharacterized membrane protein YkvA (DUF1232 family)